MALPSYYYGSDLAEIIDRKRIEEKRQAEYEKREEKRRQSAKDWRFNGCTKTKGKR